MLIDAMKSAGPKMIVSTRGDALAIASTAMRPCAFSICASMPIRPTSKPMVFSIWVSKVSSTTTCSAFCTLGSMMQSRFGPAPSTTSITSRYVQCVVQSLTRTTRILSPQPPSFSAATMFLRASGFTSGAQASSRSRNTWSAGRPFAFSRKRGLLPGTARQERRGRSVAASEVIPTACLTLRAVRQRRPGRCRWAHTRRFGRFPRAPRLISLREHRPERVMSTATRVFLARLAGIAVFDPNGDQLGRVRDAVTMLRIDRRPPRVLGLVMEVAHRHRIFVPMGRVTRIEPDQVVLSSGTVNMKRFERRTNELLVLAELLDRSVTIRENAQSAVVVDAGMELTRARDWVISRLAVRTHGARLARRRGELIQVEWDEVDGLAVLESRQGTASLLAMLAEMRAADVASVLQDMPEKRRLEVAVALDDERLADVLQEMTEDDQLALLHQLADDRAADVLEAMDDDDAADLLGDMTKADQERLLELMEPEEAEPVRRLMTYADYTAGGMMTSEPVIMLPDATVAEALALVRNPDLSPALAAQVYVVRPPQATPTGRFLGTAYLQRLLREPPSALVSGLVEKDTGTLRPDTPIDEVTRHLATYNLVAAPVVDD